MLKIIVLCAITQGYHVLLHSHAVQNLIFYNKLLCNKPFLPNGLRRPFAVLSPVRRSMHTAVNLCTKISDELWFWHTKLTQHISASKSFTCWLPNSTLNCSLRETQGYSPISLWPLERTEILQYQWTLLTAHLSHICSTCWASLTGTAGASQ